MNNSAHFLPVFVCQPKPLSLNSKHIYFVMINNVLLEIEMWICVNISFSILAWSRIISFAQMSRWSPQNRPISIQFNSGNENSNFLLWRTKKDDEKLRRRTKDHIGEKNRVCGIEVFGISQIYKVLNSILHFGEFRLSPLNPRPSFVSWKKWELQIAMMNCCKSSFWILFSL